jgi:hypothetical protein
LYSMEDEILNTWVMAVISYAAPVIILGVLGLWAVRDFYDANAVMMEECGCLRGMKWLVLQFVYMASYIALLFVFCNDGLEVFATL